MNAPWDTSLGGDPILAGSGESDGADQRKAAYIGLTVLLVVAFFGLRKIQWTGSGALHTIMEAMATLLSGSWPWCAFTPPKTTHSC